MRSGFFNDTEVWAEDFARFAAGLLTDGVLADTNDALKPTATGSNMQVQIAPGYCWIKGHFGLVENTESVTIAMADGSLPRIDRITARLDLSSDSVHLHVITGTPAETPAPPSVVRDGTYYDIGLATVALPAGALRVTNAMITDTRSDKTVCGAVIYRNADGMALDGKADKSTVNNINTALNNRINDTSTSLNNRIDESNIRITTIESFIQNNGIKLLYSGTSTSCFISNASQYSIFFFFWESSSNAYFIPFTKETLNDSSATRTILPYVAGTYGSGYDTPIVAASDVTAYWNGYILEFNKMNPNYTTKIYGLRWDEAYE